MDPPNTQQSVPKTRPFSDKTNIIKIHSVLQFQPKRSTKKSTKECKENQSISTFLISTRAKVKKADHSSQFKNEDLPTIVSNNNKPCKQLQVIIPRLDIASIINNHNVQREASSLIGNDPSKNTTNIKPYSTRLELHNNTENSLNCSREFKMLRNKNCKWTKASKHGGNLSENSSKLETHNFLDLHNLKDCYVPYKQSDLELDNRISYQVSDLPPKNMKEPSTTSIESHKLLSVLLERIVEHVEKNDLKDNQAFAESEVGLDKVNTRFQNKRNHQEKEEIMDNANFLRNNLKKSNLQNIKKNKALPKQPDKEEDVLKNVQEITKQDILEKESARSETFKMEFESNIKTSENNKNLRYRHRKNYAEETLTPTLDSSIPNEGKKTAENRVPVYRQIIEDKITEEKDLYEFDELSSDEKKPQKTKKKRKSSMFDKTTHDILQKIQKKEEKKKRRAKKPMNYATTINTIVTKVMKQIEKQDCIKEVSSSEKTSSNKSMDLVTKRVKIIEEKQTENTVVLETLPGDKNPSIRPTVRKNLDEIELCDSINQENDNKLESLQDVDDNLFGFDVLSPPPSPVKINPRINILNDITLNTGNILASPSQFHSKRPNANSTFVHNEHQLSTSQFEEQQGEVNNTVTRVNNFSRSPWRFNLGQVRRNPHFLNLKNSGLPCLDQDMVLDHTHVENSNERCSKTPRRLTEDRTTKSPQQTSILDFVESSIQDKENLRSQFSHPSTLYDYQDFDSPVKTRSNKIIAQKVQHVKRKVLGTITESNVAVKDVRLDVIHKSIEIQMDYFGFEDSFEVEDKDKSACAKPSRIDVNLLKKYPSKKDKGKYKHVTIVEPVEELQSEPREAIEDTHSDVDSNEVNAVVDGSEIKLFEDPEELLDQLVVSPKLKETKGRRKRLNSCSSDISDYGKPKKKRKDAKSRAEEAEFEKWVSKFNSMCKEVDEHELEIE